MSTGEQKKGKKKADFVPGTLHTCGKPCIGCSMETGKLATISKESICVICKKYALPSERVHCTDSKCRHYECFLKTQDLSTWKPWQLRGLKVE